MTAHNPTKYDPARIYAVVADEDGYVLEPEEVEAWAMDPEDEEGCAEPITLYLVTGSALPRSQSDLLDDFHRMPGSYRSLDVIAEHDLESEEPADVALRMRQLIEVAEAIQRSHDLAVITEERDQYALALHDPAALIAAYDAAGNMPQGLMTHDQWRAFAGLHNVVMRIVDAIESHEIDPAAVLAARNAEGDTHA
jgi:hypothetical protein